MRKKNIRIAEALQREIDLNLSKELQTYDDISKRFGDAFLIQLADSLSAEMGKRPKLKKLAKDMDGVLEYYKEIYPPEFAQGLIKDYRTGR